MKFFIAVVMILVSLMIGYAISARRHTSVGCGITMKWDDRVNYRIELLLIVIALPAIVILVYNPVMWIYALCNFKPLDSRLSALVIVILAMFGYDKLLSEMMTTGEHNGKIRAERAAKRCKRQCQIACEYASWGETVLECQNPTCLSCPLAEQYDIKPRIYRHDILESIYRHERLERAMRRRGQTVPTSYLINIPIERVLNKVFDAEGWYDGLADVFATQKEPAPAETCRIIPFPVQPKVEPEVLQAEIVEDKPEPVRRPRFKKIAINRGDRGLKVEDCDTYFAIRLMWTDETGKKQYSEYTLDKASPDCIYLVNDVAAIDRNAALQLQAMAIPAETL